MCSTRVFFNFNKYSKIESFNFIYSISQYLLTCIIEECSLNLIYIVHMSRLIFGYSTSEYLLLCIVQECSLILIYTVQVSRLIFIYSTSGSRSFL